MNRHANHVRDRGRERALAKLQAKFRGLCAANAAPHKLAEITAAIDKVGRVTRVPIRPPDERLPEIDKQVAELFGITERMVRKCRTDPKLQQFMPHPVWLERDWVKQGRLDFEARQVAKRLMTPERYAKGEPLIHFVVDNNVVKVTDKDGAMLRYPDGEPCKQVLGPADNPSQIAARLARGHRREYGDRGFWATLGMERTCRYEHQCHIEYDCQSKSSARWRKTAWTAQSAIQQADYRFKGTLKNSSRQVATNLTG
jgi:hypothetical protein